MESDAPRLNSNNVKTNKCEVIKFMKKKKKKNTPMQLPAHYITLIPEFFVAPDHFPSFVVYLSRYVPFEERESFKTRGTYPNNLSCPFHDIKTRNFSQYFSNKPTKNKKFRSDIKFENIATYLSNVL